MMTRFAVIVVDTSSVIVGDELHEIPTPIPGKTKFETHLRIKTLPRVETKTMN